LTSAVTIVFSHFTSEVYRSRGEPKVSLISQVIHLGFLIPTLILTVGHGFKVLYIARSLIRIQGIVTGLIIMHARYGFKILTNIKNVIPMIVSALIMGIAGLGLQYIMDHMIWDFISIFICILIYFASLFFLFPKTRREIADSAFGQKVLGKLKGLL
ncbi:MAG: lipopolysaccharide biosynthesis protein, partial [Clostridia bacterium]|nr:lipopolysaccharide biosynthesis protein [Clostridia bacterium]